MKLSFEPSMKVGFCCNDDEAPKVKRIWTSFILYAFGVFLVYSAYGTLLSLQSSINVVDGLGTTALAAIYVSAVIFSVLCVPGLLRKFGAKKCMCCCEITYFIYTIANFYPTYYTMLPASLVVGMGDCLLWACMPIMNSFFATEYSSASGKNKGKSEESRFSGYFFAIFQLSKISGNLVSYAVLYGFSDQSMSNDATNNTFALENSTTPSSVPAEEIDHFDFSYCGANDCQDAEAVSNAIEQYVPASKWALYVLLIVMALLGTIAVVLHVIYIPNTGDFGVTQKRDSIDSMDDTVPSDKFSKTSLLRHNRDDEDIEKMADAALIKKKEAEVAFKPMTEKESIFKFAFSLARDILLQMTNVKQLLLIPMIFYAGLAYGFITSELTRSYTSCVFGVSWVPIHATFFGVGASAVCYVMGKLSKRVPRYVFVAFAAICDGCAYIYCLLWEPNPSSHLSVIPMYFIIGGMQGVWLPVSQVLEVVNFPDSLDVSSPVWNFWFMSGIGTQFAWSTSLCVSTKIYIQLGLIAASLLGYGILERTKVDQKKDVGRNEAQS